MANSKETQRVIGLLANVMSDGVKGEIVKVDGKTEAKLVITCSILDKPGTTENVELTLAQFDAIYKGWVMCWPTIKPLKEQVVLAQRTETKAEAIKLRDAEKVRKAQVKAEEQEKAKKAKAEAAAAKQAEKEATKAKAKADRDALAAKAKAEKEAEAKKAADAKKKADTEALKKAADKKDKKDKSAGK